MQGISKYSSMKSNLFYWYCTLLCLVLLASCRTGKHAAKPLPVVEAPPEPVARQFACSFKPGVFEGNVPCFGYDCYDSNLLRLTRIQFRENESVEKTLGEGENRLQYTGHWKIEGDCLITVTYPEVNRIEYYRFEQGHLIRLSAAKAAFSGIFKDKYTLQRKN